MRVRIPRGGLKIRKQMDVTISKEEYNYLTERVSFLYFLYNNGLVGWPEYAKIKTTYWKEKNDGSADQK